MAQVLDYSAGFPGALNIAKANYAGAVRYIGFPNRKKCTTRGELEDFSRNGRGMALVFEDAATNWRGGYRQGQIDAPIARAHADTIGFPHGRPIYFAVDQDVVGASQIATAVDYIRGAANWLGGPQYGGAYGEHDVIAAVAQAGAAHWLWQCRAWSGTPVKLYPGRHLYQQAATVYVGGIACDVNDINASDWGQHNASPLEDDVAFTDQITVTAPGNRSYAEQHEAAQVIGDTYYWASDTHQAVNNVLVPAVAALGAAVSNGTFDQLAFQNHLDVTLKKAIDTAVVPIVQQAMRDAGASEYAEAVVDLLQKRLGQTAPQQPTA